jgi:hypothetical protein
LLVNGDLGKPQQGDGSKGRQALGRAWQSTARRYAIEAGLRNPGYRIYITDRVVGDGEIPPKIVRVV